MLLACQQYKIIPMSNNQLWKWKVSIVDPYRNFCKEDIESDILDVFISNQHVNIYQYFLWILETFLARNNNTFNNQFSVKQNHIGKKDYLPCIVLSI